VDSIQDDAEFLVWMYEGHYGFINPLDQFEFDDELSRAHFETPWPFYFILAKWRPVAFDLWRRLRRSR